MDASEYDQDVKDNKELIEFNNNPKDQRFRLSVTCPYCNYEEDDSWDYFGMYGTDFVFETDCLRCDKKFKVNINAEVSYCTYPSDT